MKTPKVIELSLNYCSRAWPNIEKHELDSLPEYHAFIDGYEAAVAIVEAELKLVEERRATQPGLGGIYYALKIVLSKLNGD